VLLLISAWVLRGYPLTQARHAEIRAALDARVRPAEEGA